MFHIRQRGNFFTHAIAAVAALPASVFLIYQSDSSKEYWSSIVYGLCFFLLFLSSALYHSIPKTEEKIRTFQKIDHASIYLMIAGTYTPTILILFSGWPMWLMIAIVWGIAAFGSISKLLGKLKNHKVSLSLYLAMGWLIVILIKHMYEVLPGMALFWLLLGGLFYSVGSYFYNLDKKKKGKYYHEIWHLFVMAGAASHYYYTLEYLIA